MDIQQITDFVQQNSTALKASGMSSTALLALSPARKAFLEQCSRYLGIFVSSKEITSKAQAEGKAAMIKAKADIEVEKIKSLGVLELNDIEKAAFQRSVYQEVDRQDNINSTVIKAVPLINDDSRPQDLDPDWLRNFFDRCPLISNPDMQLLMARLLAGEVNCPETFSKRAINFVQEMSPKDAHDFLTFCRFCVNINGNIGPLIKSADDDIFFNNGLLPQTLLNLDHIGLANFSAVDFSLVCEENEVFESMIYFGKSINIDATCEIIRGPFILTTLGSQLYGAFSPDKVDGYEDYITSNLYYFTR